MGANKAAWFINNSIWCRAFAERHSRLPPSSIARLPSFLDIVSTLLSPFPGLASAAFMPPYVPSDYAFGIVICARRRLRHPRLGLGSDPRYDEGLTGKRDGENEASITVTRPRRSSFSSDRHKSPVMTDRRRSDPSDALVQPPCHQPPRENVKGLEKRRERIARRASSLSRRGRTDGRARRKRFVIANDLCRWSMMSTGESSFHSFERVRG